MIDIVIVAKPVLQVHVIVDGRKNVLFCNVLRNQVMDIPSDSILKLIDISCRLLKKPCQHRIVDKLRNAHFLRVNVHNAVK